MSPRPANVPCNGCTHCCKDAAIILQPDDDPSLYRTKSGINPLNGEVVLVLEQKPNGDCAYLGTTGCTIHGRAPLVCQVFDCRGIYLRFDRAERKRLVKSGFVDPRTFEEGRKRLHTLTGAA